MPAAPPPSPGGTSVGRSSVAGGSRGNLRGHPQTHSMSWWWTAWGHTAYVLDALWMKMHAGWSRLPHSSKRNEDDAQDGCNNYTECVVTWLIMRVCTGMKSGWFRRRVFQLYEGRKTYLRSKKIHDHSALMTNQPPRPRFPLTDNI